MEPSKCADIVSDNIWLGFCISKDGLTAEKQLEQNLKKNELQDALLRSGGIFKKKINTKIILRV